MARRLFLPACFAWVPVAFVIVAGLQALGPPRVIWSYEWRETWAGERLYLSCSYVGSAGATVERPESGRCPWLRFGREGH